MPKLPTRIFSSTQTRSMLTNSGADAGPTVIVKETINLHGNPTQSEAFRMVQTARAVSDARVERLLQDINRGKAEARVTGRRRR